MCIFFFFFETKQKIGTEINNKNAMQLKGLLGDLKKSIDLILNEQSMQGNEHILYQCQQNINEMYVLLSDTMKSENLQSPANSSKYNTI